MILFLDFDGVLHLESVPGITPERTRDDDDHFSHLPIFEELMREFPDVEIVVSSAWRTTRSLSELKAFFSPDIAARIVSVTPELPKNMPARREQEILMWLRAEGRENESIVAVDDWPPLFSQDCNFLFWVDPELAFDELAAIRLREHMRKLS